MNVSTGATGKVSLRAALAELLLTIDREIRTYPTPIPRCDAQFNHLYELRSRIARLVPLVDTPLASDRDRIALAAALNDVLSASPAGDGAPEQALRERLRLHLRDLEASAG